MSAPKDPSPSPSAAGGRQPLLADVPPGPAASPSVKDRIQAERARQSEAKNRRATTIGWPALLGMAGLQLVLLGGVSLAGYRLVQQRLGAPPAPASAPAAAAPDLSGWQNRLEQANAQIATLQRQLDAQREDRERTQGRLQEMADRLALVIQQGSFVPSADKPRVSESDAAQVAALLPSVTPATSELVLLKERNRLTGYADQAIATGSRASLQALVDALLDPAMKHLAHAAQAEFKRVQAYYDMGISIDPGYTLPVQELFKGGKATREADLSPAQLHGLLQDAKQPWEARLRAAYLLRSSADPDTNALLLKALQQDPMLDVAKQAQITFENRVGRKFRLFDIPAIEAWWQAQGGGAAGVRLPEPRAK